MLSMVMEDATKILGEKRVKKCQPVKAERPSALESLIKPSKNE